MSSLHSRSPTLSELQRVLPARSQQRSRRVQLRCVARCQSEHSHVAERRIVVLAAAAALVGRSRKLTAAEEPQTSPGAVSIPAQSPDAQDTQPPSSFPAAETPTAPEGSARPEGSASPTTPSSQPEQKPSASKGTNGQGQTPKLPNTQSATPPEAGGAPGGPAVQPEPKPPAGKGANGQTTKPSNGQAKQPSSAADDLSIEEARKLLSEEEERRKQRRRRKGRLRELEEIRAELAEKELVLLEREQEVLEREQTVGTLREQLEIEKKLRALLTKEKEKAEEEAALSMGICGGGFMLP